MNPGYGLGTSDMMAAEPALGIDKAETPAALLNRANRAYAARSIDDAKRLYQTLLETDAHVGWAYFGIGRILRDQDDFEGAMRAFEAAIHAEGSFFWAHYELVDLMVRQMAPAELLGSVLAALCELRFEQLRPPHVHRLEHASTILWEAGHFAEAVLLLERLADDPALSELGIVRIVERSGNATYRARAASRLIALPPTRDFAFRVLGNYFHETGNVAMETRCLEQLSAVAPSDFQTHFGLARALARNGDKQALAALRTKERKFTPQQRTFVELVVRLEEGNGAAALSAFRSMARLFDEAPLFPGIRLCYMLAADAKPDTRDEVLSILRAFHPASHDVALVEMNVCIEQQDLAKALDVFDTRLASITPRPMNVTLAEMDLRAHLQQTDRACAIADALLASEEVTQPAFRNIVRVFSEAGRHADVVALALRHIATETVPDILSIVVRSARKADGLRAVFAALPTEASLRNNAQQLTYEALIEDIAATGDTGVIDALDQAGLSEDRLHRIESRLGQVRRRAGQRPGEQVVFLCADADYLIPAMVAVTSAGMSNMEMLRRTPFAILADAGETLDRARDAAKAISRRLGMSLEVFDATNIVTSSETLNARYGFFTGGQSLSLAAYYRIFFAEYLAAEGKFDKALYIDSDVVVRHGLDKVFEVPSDQPLLARPEVDRVEVNNAVRALGLQGRYFNSGVLRFDYRHPDTRNCLAEAIRCATDPTAVRLFQDQCALNLGFQLKHDDLPVSFNHFHVPRQADADLEEQRSAVVVHYIDRPKPWDSLYRRNAREWFGWYNLVNGIIAVDG